MASEDLGKKWATNEDWIRIRPLFTELYREKKLREVQQVLEEQHGFYATYAESATAGSSLVVLTDTL